MTRYLSQATGDVLRRFERHDAEPFFLWVSHVAPHNSLKGGCRERLLGATTARAARLGRPARRPGAGPVVVGVQPGRRHRQAVLPARTGSPGPRTTSSACSSGGSSPCRRSTARSRPRSSGCDGPANSIARCSCSPPTTATSSASTGTSGSGCRTRGRCASRCSSAARGCCRAPASTTWSRRPTSPARSCTGRCGAAVPARRRGAARRPHREGCGRPEDGDHPPDRSPGDARPALALPRLPRCALHLRPLSRRRLRFGLRGALRPASSTPPRSTTSRGRRPTPRCWGSCASGRARCSRAAARPAIPTGRRSPPPTSERASGSVQSIQPTGASAR